MARTPSPLATSPVCLDQQPRHPPVVPAAVRRGHASRRTSLPPETLRAVTPIALKGQSARQRSASAVCRLRRHLDAVAVPRVLRAERSENAAPQLLSIDAPFHSELSGNVIAPGFAGSPLRGAVPGYTPPGGGANSLFHSAGAAASGRRGLRRDCLPPPLTPASRAPGSARECGIGSLREPLPHTLGLEDQNRPDPGQSRASGRLRRHRSPHCPPRSIALAGLRRRLRRRRSPV